MKTIGIISDTHTRPGSTRQIPRRVFEAFEDVDFILHAGDLTHLHVLLDLEAIAPTFGVQGNNDDWGVLDKLPVSRLLTVENCNIGLVHGHVPHGARASRLDIAGNTQTAGNALSHFLDNGVPTVDCVIFGHSHYPVIYWHEIGDRKVLLFNPGSPNDRRYGPHYGIGILRVDGKELSPELILW
jgi:putative phosphoesterase